MMPPEKPEPRRRQEGNVVHLETQFRARLQMLVAWEMRREAREIVKRKLKAQGVKVSLVSASTITQTGQRALAAQRGRTAARGRGLRHCAELASCARAEAR
jgi:hypothetical protein